LQAASATSASSSPLPKPVDQHLDTAGKVESRLARVLFNAMEKLFLLLSQNGRAFRMNPGPSIRDESVEKFSNVIFYDYELTTCHSAISQVANSPTSTLFSSLFHLAQQFTHRVLNK
jgi:hypothetical protein